MKKIKLSLDYDRIKILCDKRVLLSTSIVYLTAYYYMLLSEPINADWLTLGFLKYHGAYWYDQIGRWGRRYAEALVYKVNNPLISHLVCCLCISASASLIIQMWKIRGNLFKTMIGPILVVSPAIVDTMQYFHDLLFYSFALLTAVLAGYVAVKYRGVISWLLSTMLIVLSLSLYQPYLNSFVFLIVGSVILSLISDKGADHSTEWIHMIKKGASAGVAGCIAYYALWKVIKFLRKTPQAEYAGIDTIDEPRSISLIMSQMKNAYLDFCSFYRRDMTLFISMLWKGIILLAFIAFLLISYRQIRQGKIKRVVMATVIIVVMPALCNPVCIVARSNGGPRGEFMCQLMAPFTIALISELANSERVHTKILYVLKMVCLLCCMGLFFGMWTRAYSSIRTWDIGNRTTRFETAHALIHAMEDNRYTNGMPIVFMGIADMSFAQEMNPLHEYAYNDPYVIWDNDKDMAILGDWRKYVAYNFGIDIGEITDVEYEEILKSEEFKRMAEYPSDDAYSVIDGKYVILLDRETVGY